MLLAVGGPGLAIFALLLFTSPFWIAGLGYLGEKLRWWDRPTMRGPSRVGLGGQAGGGGQQLQLATSTTPTPTPRRGDIQPLSATAARFWNRLIMVAILAIIGTVMFQSCGRGRVMTPAERYYWDHGEGRAIRDEQELYEDRIPRGR